MVIYSIFTVLGVSYFPLGSFLKTQKEVADKLQRLKKLGLMNQAMNHASIED